MKAKSFVPDDGMVRPPAEDLELLRTWAFLGKASAVIAIVHVAMDLAEFAQSYF